MDNAAVQLRWQNLRAKRKSGSVKFLSNEKEYTLLSLFLWEVPGARGLVVQIRAFRAFMANGGNI